MKITNKFKLIGASMVLATIVPLQAQAIVVPTVHNRPSTVWNYDLGDNPAIVRNSKTPDPTLYLQVQVAENGTINFEKPITFTNHRKEKVDTEVHFVLPNNKVVPIHFDKDGKATQKATEPVEAGEYSIAFAYPKGKEVTENLGYGITTKWNNYAHTSLTIKNVKVQTLEQIQQFEQAYSQGRKQQNKDAQQKLILMSLLLVAAGATMYTVNESEKKAEKKLRMG